jgi:plasmid maintenance system antidote protein VapI
MRIADAPPTADDLRALFGRFKVPAYVVAARIRLHPVHLSRILHGHVPLTAEMAHRIVAEIQEEANAVKTRIMRDTTHAH